MIWFKAPYRGTDKASGMPILLIGYNGRTSSFIVIEENGDTNEVAAYAVNIDIRYKADTRSWADIDLPED